MATNELGVGLTEWPLGIVMSKEDIISYRRVKAEDELAEMDQELGGFLVTIILRNGRSYDDIHDKTGLLSVTLDMIKGGIAREDLNKNLYAKTNLDMVFQLIENGNLYP